MEHAIEVLIGALSVAIPILVWVARVSHRAGGAEQQVKMLDEQCADCRENTSDGLEALGKKIDAHHEAYHELNTRVAVIDDNVRRLLAKNNVPAADRTRPEGGD